jgi:hypothetical protein
VVSAIRDAIRPEIAAQVRQELPLREAYKAFAARCDDLIEGEDMSEYAFLAAWKEEVEARLRPEGEK